MRRFSIKRIAASPSFQRAAGIAIALYLRLVWKTCRVTVEPHDVYQWIDDELPIILAMWHGQHIMAPFVRRNHHRVKVLISRHRDGEINAVAAEHLGVGTIRGSGGHGPIHQNKGGVPAFMAMLETLRGNCNVALTADVPKVARVVGRGIILLARESGRPIYPVAIATSRRIELNNWDRSAINLPFSHCAIVAGAPVSVAADADEPAMEAARLRLQAGLTSATDRAYAIVDAGRAKPVGEVARG